jgi:hypothetical protein
MILTIPNRCKGAESRLNGYSALQSFFQPDTSIVYYSDSDSNLGSNGVHRYRSKSKPFGPGILAEMIQHAALEPVPGAGFPARQVWCMPRQTEDPVRIKSIQLPSDNSRKYRACNLFKSLPDSSGLEGLLYNLRKVASGYLYDPPAICCRDSTESTEYINFCSSGSIS